MPNLECGTFFSSITTISARRALWEGVARYTSKSLALSGHADRYVDLKACTLRN